MPASDAKSSIGATEVEAVIEAATRGAVEVDVVTGTLRIVAVALAVDATARDRDRLAPVVVILVIVTTTTALDETRIRRALDEVVVVVVAGVGALEPGPRLLPREHPLVLIALDLIALPLLVGGGAPIRDLRPATVEVVSGLGHPIAPTDAALLVHPLLRIKALRYLSDSASLYLGADQPIDAAV